MKLVEFSGDTCKIVKYINRTLYYCEKPQLTA